MKIILEALFGSFAGVILAVVVISGILRLGEILNDREIREIEDAKKHI